MLKKTYGEFYLADLVEAQNSDMKVIALEPNGGGNAVGFMSATSLFDTEFVNKEYNLQPFNFLQKHNDHEVSIASRVTQLLTMQAECPIIDADSSETDTKTMADVDGNVESETNAILRTYQGETFQRLSKLLKFRNIFFIKRSAFISDSYSTINFIK